MANTLTNVLHKILARALRGLRESVVMPRLVNNDYSTEARKKGSTIDIPVPAAATAAAVTPAETPPAPASKAPSVVQITLSSWYHSDFHLTDNELTQIDRNEHFVPMQMGEAIRALANQVNGDIFSEYASVYGYTGTAGTTPFGSDATDASNLRKVLSSQLCPKDRLRRAVIDYDAEAQASVLAAFANAEKSADPNVVREGDLGRKYGFDWHTDDAVPTHTAGTASGATTDSTGYAIGLKTITLASAGTGTILVGDVITFAGDTQTYVVTAGDADVSGGGTVSFEPGLKVAIETSAHAITLKATHVVNMGFHRDAFAFASRPLLESMIDRQVTHSVVQPDPVSGLVMRLELIREFKQTAYDLDILYGFKCVRPEFAARLAG